MYIINNILYFINFFPVLYEYYEKKKKHSPLYLFIYLLFWHSFLLSVDHISVLFYYPSALKISFNISCHGVLWATKFLCFHFSEEIFILPLFSRIFLLYRTLGGKKKQVFSFFLLAFKNIIPFSLDPYNF